MQENLINKYIEKKRKVKRVFRNEIVEYTETYYLDCQTNEEIYYHSVEMRNNLCCVDAYRQKKGLLTSEEIKNIRKKYGMSQKDYSLALGLGEITVHRYEKGSIQSFGDNQLMLFSKNPDLLFKMFDENKDCYDEERYNKILTSIEKQNDLFKHQVISKEKLTEIKGDFVSADVTFVAKHICYHYKKMACGSMSLSKLHKLLYYIQGLSLYVFDKPAFFEDIYSSVNGPYLKSFDDVSNSDDKVYLSEGLYQLCRIVIEEYGKYESYYLSELSLKEFPYKDKESLIKIDKIRNYFVELYK